MAEVSERNRVVYVTPDGGAWLAIDVPIRRATRALVALREAMLPRTEAEYWQWLRHNDPLRYIIERRAMSKPRDIPVGAKRL